MRRMQHVDRGVTCTLAGKMTRDGPEENNADVVRRSVP